MLAESRTTDLIKLLSGRGGGLACGDIMVLTAGYHPDPILTSKDNERRRTKEKGAKALDVRGWA